MRMRNASTTLISMWQGQRPGALLLLLSSVFILLSSRPAIAIDFDVSVTADTTFHDNIPPFNDTLVTRFFHVDPDDSLASITLSPHDSVTFNFNFNRPISMIDNFFDNTESIRIALKSLAGNPVDPGNTILGYSFLFTGVTGTPLGTNPVPGTAPWNAFFGDIDSFLVDRNVSLFTTGIVNFHDIHVTLTNNDPDANSFVFNQISIGLDAEDLAAVPAPAPSTIFLLGTGLA